jgi:hypothetical protein
MVRRMLAFSLGQAKTIAVVVMIAFVVLGLVSAWLLKTVVQKVVVLVVLLGLAGVVWYQRDSLQECADEARARAEARDVEGELTCSFVGQDVTFRARR